MCHRPVLTAPERLDDVLHGFVTLVHCGRIFVRFWSRRTAMATATAPQESGVSRVSVDDARRILDSMRCNRVPCTSSAAMRTNRNATVARM